LTGLYGILLSPFFLLSTRNFDTHKGPLRNTILWLTLAWLPLAFGLLFAIVGTYYTIPAIAPVSPSFTQHYADDDLDEDEDDSNHSRPDCIITKVKLIHPFFLLLIPTGISITITALAFLSNDTWTKAQHLEKQWQLNYSQMSAFTSKMVQDSQLIWYTQLKAAKIAAIIFIIYTLMAVCMGLVYIYVVVKLIIALHEDIARSKELKDEEQVQQDPVRISQIIIDALKEAAVKSNEAEIEEAEEKKQSRIRTSSSITLMQASKEEEEMKQEQKEVNANDTFSTTSTQEATTSKLLESALLHIYLQALAIILGFAAIASISLSYAILLYGKLEQPSKDGGNLFEHHIGAIWLALMYSSCLAGGISIFAVAYKTCEPLITTSSPSHINFSDIIKGLSHVRTTFFKSGRADEAIGSTDIGQVEAEWTENRTGDPSSSPSSTKKALCLSEECHV
jgi:ABC-type multidrug transport system fused ATPase/permease subunit